MSDKRLPDEKATMTYVSSYYHTFSGAQKVIPRLFFPTKDFRGSGLGPSVGTRAPKSLFTNALNPPLDQVPPLQSWGTRPGVRPVRQSVHGGGVFQRSCF